MTKLRDIVSEIPEQERSLYDKMDAVAERIARLMETRGLNQEQLAEKMGKHKSYISRVLGGGVNLTLKTLAEFESALDAAVLTIPDARRESTVPSRTGVQAEEKSAAPAPGEIPSDPPEEGESRAGLRLPSTVWQQLQSMAREEGVHPETLAVTYVVRGMAEEKFSAFELRQARFFQDNPKSTWHAAKAYPGERILVWMSDFQSGWCTHPRSSPRIAFHGETFTDSDDGEPQDTLLRRLYGKSVHSPESE